LKNDRRRAPEAIEQQEGSIGVRAVSAMRQIVHLSARSIVAM